MFSKLLCCFSKTQYEYIEYYKCKYCGATYETNQDLVYHIKYYHVDREETYLLDKKMKL